MARLRRLLAAAALATVVAPAASLLAVLVAGLERAPAVAAAPAPTPEDARRAYAVLDAARALATRPGASATLALSPEDLASLAAVAGRLLPGLRAEASIDDRGVVGRLSAPAPFAGGRLWWNLRARAPAPAAALGLEGLRLGAAPLPGGLALGAAAFAADAVLAGAPARTVLGAIRGVSVEGGALALRVALTDATRAALAGAGGGAWSALADVDAAVVERRLADIAATRRDGPLAPLLAVVLRAAADEPGAGAREIGGALVALGVACGERRLIEAVSPGLFDATRRPFSACWRVLLDGRRDLKQHFVLSAAFVAAGRDAQAFALGEMKELLDAADGGSGFSFDDLAADRAGVRFARLALAGGPEAWRAAADLLDAGAALLPPLDGLASGLDAAAFARDYGDLDDPRYAALVAEIDRRLDALPVFAPWRAAAR